MAELLKPIELSKTNPASLPQPIIYCESVLDTEIGFSLNIPLAKMLMTIKPNRRTMRLEQCLMQVLKQLPADPVIRDIDVLFNPEYEADILWILASVGKNLPFRLLWPGKYEYGRLFYAEEGYRDYKAYDLNKYNVTCII